MALFVLVHGSMHGGWCWRDLVPELERRGHFAVTPDLPCEDAGAGLAQYADAVDAAIDDLEAGRVVGHGADPAADPAVETATGGSITRVPLVLVGHSLGSRTIPVVATRRPGAQMIFLCSVPTGAGPVDAAAFAGMVSDEYASARFDGRADGARRIDDRDACRVFYSACDERTARWAASRLRWQGPRPLAEAAPFSSWPSGRLDVVLTRDDRTVRFEWARDEARRWLAGRDPVVLPGDHSPFLSCPSLLADALCALIAG